MAEFAVIIGSREDIQIVSGGASVDVIRATVSTITHGVIFDVLIPVSAWDAFDHEGYVDPLAMQIESYLRSGRAIGASYVEDLDANGLVEFFIDFTIMAPPQSAAQIIGLTAPVRVPLEALGDRFTINAIVEPAFEKAETALAQWAGY